MANLGAYGYPLPPNAPTRVAPAEWRSFRAFLTNGSSTFTVPQNVYQIMALVFGGGAAGGGGGNGPGPGRGFAMGIIDVVPGQTFPPITVGAASGTSSVGTLLTATGGAGAGGAGTASASLRGAFTAPGGSSAGNFTGAGGCAAESPYGTGGASGTVSSGGAAFGAATGGNGGSAAGVASIRSIARGTVPLAMFGSEGYAILMGRLALPTLLATAAAPLLGVWLLDWLGPYGTLYVLFGAGLVNVALVLPLIPIALRR